MQCGSALLMHSDWARVEPLAIEQEKVNQSSIAANKKQPFKSVEGPDT